MTFTEAIQAAGRSTIALAYLGGAALVTLITIPIALSTFQGILAEDRALAAVEAFHQRTPHARALLRKWRDSGDPSASVLLGSLELESANSLEKLETAQRLFQEALDAQPGRTSAVLGLVSTRLRMAELDEATDLAAAAGDCEALLRQADDQDLPDVAYLRGAIMVLQGKVEDGAAALESDPNVAPGAAGQGARWWNLAVARVLLDQDPLPAAARAYTLRARALPAEERERDENDLGPDYDPARLLRAAYRFSLADPACKPNDKDSLNARADFGRKLGALEFSSGRGRGQRGGLFGRYLPHKRDAPEILNAIGQGLYRVERFNEAAEVFAEAAKLDRTNEIVYMLNAGHAALRAYREDKSLDEVRRKTLLNEVKIHLEKAANTLMGQKDRTSLLKLAVDNKLSVLWDTNARAGADSIRRYQKEYPSEADYERNLGAMLDWRCKSSCLKHYKRAVELGHPDSAAIQERIRLHEKPKQQ
ncbi:MAG TPA: hypothetical protein DEA08_33465 [Planctomycetes bacterium]|nr:hypothetical protein [Planctomycetota bacterium]